MNSCSDPFINTVPPVFVATGFTNCLNELLNYIDYQIVVLEPL